jgi:hypothetical protein
MVGRRGRPPDMGGSGGAGDENRTRIASLEAPPEDDRHEQVFALVTSRASARV